MRYRLRTLLIVVTLAALVFTRIGYLKQKAQFHRREAERIALKISTIEQDSLQDVNLAIKRLSEGLPAPNDKLETGINYVFGSGYKSGYNFVLGNGLKYRIVHSETANDWRRAIWHYDMANEYERDIFRLRSSTKPLPY